MKCKHISSVSPVKDSTDWVIGRYCDKCMKFWPRKDLPNYELRMVQKLDRARVFKIKEKEVL